MSHPCCGAPEDNGREDEREQDQARRLLVPSGLVEGLALAASPTFVAMALLTFGLGRDPAAMMCSGDGPPWIGSMGTMYLLMGAFHAPPWLRWLRPQT